MIRPPSRPLVGSFAATLAIGLAVVLFVSPILPLNAMQAATSASADSTLTRESQLRESRERALHSGETRALELQRQLAATLGRQWMASRAPALPGWQRILHLAERASGFAWKGPLPVVLTVPDAGRGFVCPEGRCDGRFEGVRVVFGDSLAADTVVVGVILLAESAMMANDVWQHELTHALLAQRGLNKQSERHDPRYFQFTRRIVASRVNER